MDGPIHSPQAITTRSGSGDIYPGITTPRIDKPLLHTAEGFVEYSAELVQGHGVPPCPAVLMCDMTPAGAAPLAAWPASAECAGEVLARESLD
ncbi:MAG TPA: hypothetical protein VFI46_09985 [Jiangellaceae bacterium]|nr:hypothetical protein [Jiangellaceae bacterium]